MRQLTVLHTESSEGWGGQEVRILTEAAGIMKRGHRILLACQPESRIAKRAPEYGIEVIKTRIGALTDIAGILAMNRIIRKHGVDLVSTHSSKDGWTGGLAAKLAGVKVIRTRHLGESVGTSSAAQFLYAKLPDAVVTTGEAVRNLLMRDVKVPPEKIVSIPTGVDLDRFDPDKTDREAFRRELGVGPECILIGTLSMLRKVKGHSFVIQAGTAVIQKAPEVRFVFVGDIAFQSDIKERLKKEIADAGLEGKVFMPGFRADVPSVLAAMDIFVHASMEEGVSQAISQALAMKRPSVATDAGSTKEQIIDGETGVLVDRANAEQLSSAILKIIRDPDLARRMAENGREHIKKHFSLTGMIDATEQVYASLFPDGG